ncbi:hypothetical protein WJX79_005137 [Trebouxia sp. C0005]
MAVKKQPEPRGELLCERKGLKRCRAAGPVGSSPEARSSIVWPLCWYECRLTERVPEPLYSHPGSSKHRTLGHGNCILIASVSKMSAFTDILAACGLPLMQRLSSASSAD